VGRAKLYLLDTNDPANLPTHRCITSQLYGGGPELRLQQEMVLGLAGWRLLYALGIRPEVCHLNEGHAAFVVLERALSYMEEQHQPFDVALTVTRAGNLFTTHTPVEAGCDRFPPTVVRQYLQRYAEHELRVEFHDLLNLGRANRFDHSEPFNMALLAVRGSGAVNGVSQLHGTVSKRIFQPLFPRWPQAEVPVGYVANGVHVPTWDSVEADELWTTKCGKERWRGALESVERLKGATDEELWDLRTRARQALVEYTRQRLSRQRTYQGASQLEIAQANSIFHPESLTIGFARRFATYKRPDLLLYDRDRLVRILTNRQCPVQLVVAGKAHPQDHSGQAMIKQWSDFISRSDVCPSVVFLNDYDVLLASHLVQGVDLWLNTPRRSWEASGTSGMKVLVNGGLNLSEIDGWWAEAYSPELGWAIGDGQEHGDDPGWDAHEAEALYDLLEKEVVPAFYNRDKGGIPIAWVAKMRASMLQLTPRFSSNRTVREYVERYYLSACNAYRDRAMNRSELGIELSDWSKSLGQHWSDVRFGTITSQKESNNYIFEVEVFFGQLCPNAAAVELYADPGTTSETFCQRMDVARQPDASDNHFLYSAKVPANRPASDYTPRVIPCKLKASVPLEAPYISWQH
jgi:starch phosphorylase